MSARPQSKLRVFVSWMFARQSNHVFKGPTWLKPVHCIVKLSLKLAVKGQGEATNQCTPGIVCICLFSVFMGHKESLE